MLLGILVLITALTISAVAIYYSVAGLVGIFAAAAVPIIIMGGALEIGKLVTAVWLHRYWHQTTWWLKTYLTLAVVVLMFITSMGIFGFLSKAHIEQTAAAEEGIAQIERIDEELIRQEALITRAEQRIQDAEASIGEGNDAVQAQIDKEQERIDAAYDRIQPAIDEQNQIIQAQLNALEDRVGVYTAEIASLDGELSRLNSLVEQYRTEIANTSVASIQEQIQPFNDQIAQLDQDLETLNQQANEYEERVNALELDNSALYALQAQIAKIEESIVVTTNMLQSNEPAKISEGQAIIGVTSDGLFGGNTRRALTAWVDAQQERITNLQSQSLDLRTQAQDSLDRERTRLTAIIDDIRGPQTDRINDRKQSLADNIEQIRSNAIEDSRTVRADIQAKIDEILNEDIPTVRAQRQKAQQTISQLRRADDPRINAARQAIKDLRAGADNQVTASNELIQRLRDSLSIGANETVEQVITAQRSAILEANNQIDSVIEQKYALQAEYRKLEAEVGPVKYLAEFVYGDTADQDLLEEAVRWVILIIIFVFDPLAVLLLIASQYTFALHRPTPPTSSGPKKKDKPKPAPKPEPEVEIKPEPEVDEFKEMEKSRAERIEKNVPPEFGEKPKSLNIEQFAKSFDMISDNGEDKVKEALNVDEQERLDKYEEMEQNLSWKDAKTRWKDNNPNESIKIWKKLYISGKVDRLPWEDELDEGYVQNGEQSNPATIWKNLNRE